jgi:hypothetical protein
MALFSAPLLIPEQDYSVEGLTPTQRAMLEDLRDYGLVWQRKVPHESLISFSVLADFRS